MGDERAYESSGGALDEARLSERTAGALREMYGARLEVTRGVDEAVMGEARRRLGRRGNGWRIGRWGTGLAAAAVVVVGVTAWMVVARPGRVNGRTDVSGADASVARVGRAALAGDFNGDGRVDILDALWLARALDAGSTEVSGADTSVARDVNRDGVVDRKDVDAVAMRAVSLGGGA